VGDVELGGGSLPAVRVELLPFALNRYGISMDDVRAAVQASNANRPKGAVEGDGQRCRSTPAPAPPAAGCARADYRDLVIAWRNGAAVRLRDVAEVLDGVENVNTLGLFNGEPAVIVLVTRQPAANVIETVDGVRALLPELQAQLPQGRHLQVASDSTNSIRASLHEVELTLVISIVLVVLVVSAVPAQRARHHHPGGGHGGFAAGHLRRDVPAGLFAEQPEPDGADGGHRLRGRRRHRGAGEHQPPHRGRHGPLQGGAAGRARGRLHRAVDQPVAGGGVHSAAVHGRAGGRLFREFAVTLSAAVMISLVISLTTTPMMCAWLLKPDGARQAQAARAAWRAGLNAGFTTGCTAVRDQPGLGAATASCW
jgi:multidrug efflux pump